MQNFSIRKISPSEIEQALSLCLDVFMEFEAPDYTEEGVESFKSTGIQNKAYLAQLTVYAAFDGERMSGVIATRSFGSHIALFFVRAEYQKQGIGKALFEYAMQRCTTDTMTVNSSPYAKEIYHHLGFVDTDAEQQVSGIRYTPMVCRNSGVWLWSKNLSDYLVCDDVVDYDSKNIRALSQKFFDLSANTLDYIKMCYEFVRDNIAHSADIGKKALVYRASDVLEEGHGICFSKSHLLAALLRCEKIPCGFCYQKLAVQKDGAHLLVYHGLNGVYISEADRWIRLDARGRSDTDSAESGIKSHFAFDKDHMCFSVNLKHGEKDGFIVFPSPDEKVMEKLCKYRTRDALWNDLPTELSH